MTDRLTAAVRNNARWCDAVCRAHGVPTSWQDDWWLAGRRSPRFYPDAISLRAAASFETVAERIEDGSVKDSWAEFDLARYGYRLLFQAQWITLDPAEAPNDRAASRWQPVDTADELAAWSRAAGLPGTFPPALLDDPEIRFLAERDAERDAEQDGERDGGTIVAGGIANASDAVVGVSNVFGGQPWSGLVAAVGRSFPGRPLVGYAQPDALAGPAGVGFRTLGPLRIWQAIARP